MAETVKNEGLLAFPGKGIEALSVDQKKIRELEKQLKDVEIDREILKKTLTILSSGDNDPNRNGYCAESGFRNRKYNFSYR